MKTIRLKDGTTWDCNCVLSEDQSYCEFTCAPCTQKTREMEEDKFSGKDENDLMRLLYKLEDHFEYKGFLDEAELITEAIRLVNKSGLAG